MALSLKKILKNTTISDIEINSAGMTVLTTEDYMIPPQEYTLFASETVINELTTFINSGDLVVNNGTDDLAADEGIRYLQYPDRVITLERTADRIFVPEQYDFKGNVTTEKSGATLIVNVGGDPSNGGDDLLGNIWKTVFAADNSVRNKWLDLEHNAIPSDQSPAIMTWKSKLVGISFTNDRRAGTILEIHKELAGNGSQTQSQVLTWTLTDCRLARKTDFPSDLIYEKGDKLAVFLKNQPSSTDPKNVIITLYWKILEQNEETVVYDISNNNIF